MIDGCFSVYTNASTVCQKEKLFLFHQENGRKSKNRLDICILCIHISNESECRYELLLLDIGLLKEQTQAEYFCSVCSS